MRRILCLLLTLVSFSPALAGAAGDADAPKSIADQYRTQVSTIVDAALASDGAWRKLEQLCDDIGHRISGSPRLEKAVQWAADAMKADGHENVRLEPVTVRHWVRGNESLEMTAPRHESLVLLGLGGSVGTPPEGVTGEVVVVGDEEQFEAAADRLDGRIVLFNNPMQAYDPHKGAGYGTAVRFRGKGPRMAAEKGAIACLVRSVTAKSLRSPHTGGTNYGDAERKIPAAAISIEDAEMISRLAKRGVPVSVTLKMEARELGPAQSYNVVAELRGRELPDEVVVIGGHIDSWDVGQGAHDDGAGCVMAMEALTVLRKLDLRPRRTIRVVLWTNEEHGLAGGKQYAADHKAEMPNHVAAIESDSGGFAPRGYSVESNDEAKSERAAGRMRDILTLFERFGATNVEVGHSGADISPMKNDGVVLMGHNVDGEHYFDYHHTHADTLDKVDPAELAQNVAVMAGVAYILADMPDRLGN